MFLFLLNESKIATPCAILAITFVIDAYLASLWILTFQVSVTVASAVVKLALISGLLIKPKSWYFAVRMRKPSRLRHSQANTS
jgi:hypothetical protein